MRWYCEKLAFRELIVRSLSRAGYFIKLSIKGIACHTVILNANTWSNIQVPGKNFANSNRSPPSLNLFKMHCTTGPRYLLIWFSHCFLDAVGFSVCFSALRSKANSWCCFSNSSSSCCCAFFAATSMRSWCSSGSFDSHAKVAARTDSTALRRHGLEWATVTSLTVWLILGMIGGSIRPWYNYSKSSTHLPSRNTSWPSPSIL
jgi:hypothetical protein